LSHIEKGSTKNNIGTPHKNTNMNSKENEDFENRINQLKNQVDEMNGSMLKLVDLTHSHESIKMEMEKKMNENSVWEIIWMKLGIKWKRR
jgi:hypothetical protein